MISDKNLQLEKLEELENKYLEILFKILHKDKESILEDLLSHNKIKDDWFGYWDNQGKKSKGSILSVGIERIVHHSLGRFQANTNPNPIASDLFFETEDAFIHLDVKSVQTDNIGDINEKISIEANQTSYKSDIKVLNNKKLRPYAPSLPTFYSHQSKYCLTYFLTFLYEKKLPNNILNINLICMPNGQLVNVYGSQILAAGKNPQGNKTGGGKEDPKARFVFKRASQFNLLSNKSRIKVIYFDIKMAKEYKNKLKFIQKIYFLQKQL